MRNLHETLYVVLVNSPINHEHVIDILTFFVINTLLLSGVYLLVKVYIFVTRTPTEDEKYDAKRIASDIAANTVTILLLSFVTVIFFLETGWYVNTFLWFGTNIVLGLIGDDLVSVTFSERHSIANQVYSKVSGILFNIVNRLTKK